MRANFVFTGPARMSAQMLNAATKVMVALDCEMQSNGWSTDVDSVRFYLALSLAASDIDDMLGVPLAIVAQLYDVSADEIGEPYSARLYLDLSRDFEILARPVPQGYTGPMMLDQLNVVVCALAKEFKRGLNSMAAGASA